MRVLFGSVVLFLAVKVEAVLWFILFTNIISESLDVIDKDDVADDEDDEDDVESDNLKNLQ